MAAIAAAVIAALGTYEASDSANSNQLIQQAGQADKGPGNGGKPYTPTAAKFAPGVSGTGDGSMPVKDPTPPAGGMGAGAAMDQLGPNPGSQQAPIVQGPSGPGTANAYSAPTPQPSTQPPPTDNSANQTISNASQLAGIGMGLGQMLQGQAPQAMPVAQVGGQGYQPTAISVLQQLAQAKKKMGY